MGVLESLWRALFVLPPETAHSLALMVLKHPLPVPKSWTIHDPFSWRGLTFRNRVGIAAGADKDGVALHGLKSLGAGFVEVGTVLTAPHTGNLVSPRMARLVEQDALWNRLGFPSAGVEAVAARLDEFTPQGRKNMLLACNIGPHPLHVKAATTPEEFLQVTRADLLELAQRLHGRVELFVVNLSSPNTPGLRQLTQDPRLASEVIRPLKAELTRLDSESLRARFTPLLLKLAPETADRRPWNEDQAALAKVVEPLLPADTCDGFVAVNTSVSQALQLMPGVGDALPGGVSGAPVKELGLHTVKRLRQMVGRDKLIIGVGGILEPLHAVAYIEEAGADLVEVYSGLVLRGPWLIRDVAHLLWRRRLARERLRTHPPH